MKLWFAKLFSIIESSVSKSKPVFSIPAYRSFPLRPILWSPWAILPLTVSGVIFELHTVPVSIAESLELRISFAGLGIFFFHEEVSPLLGLTLLEHELGNPELSVSNFLYHYFVFVVCVT